MCSDYVQYEHRITSGSDQFLPAVPVNLKWWLARILEHALAVYHNLPHLTKKYLHLHIYLTLWPDQIADFILLKQGVPKLF